jgi:hypothetical protein
MSNTSRYSLVGSVVVIEVPLSAPRATSSGSDLNLVASTPGCGKCKHLDDQLGGLQAYDQH